MNRKNLLPAHRQSALHRRRSIRRWTLINGVYFALLVVAGAAYAYGTASTKASFEATADVTTLNSTLAAVRQQTATLATNLRAVQEVTQRPDWSVFLAVLAGSLGEDVVLEGVDALTPAETKAPLPHPSRLGLTATARSQAAVTQFVLRLEALRLFKRVQLEKTTAQPVGGVEGVRFQVTCTLASEATR